MLQIKMHWVGDRYWRPGPEGNDIQKPPTCPTCACASATTACRCALGGLQEYRILPLHSTESVPDLRFWHDYVQVCVLRVSGSMTYPPGLKLETCACASRCDCLQACTQPPACSAQV